MIQSEGRHQDRQEDIEQRDGGQDRSRNWFDERHDRPDWMQLARLQVRCFSASEKDSA
jgi:hypothetical protein